MYYTNVEYSNGDPPISRGESMTERQRAVLEFIERFQAERGLPPSLREIAEHFGIAVRAVQDHLAALERKGVLRRLPGRSRGIVLADHVSAKPRRIPILGRIAAGRPVLAEEALEGEVIIDGERFARGTYFAVRVQGDSMIEEHILDGDLAIIRQQPRVESGEIAAVAIEGEVTLKRFYRTRRGVELHSANRKYRPLVVTGGDVRVLGKYCGLLRVRGK
jgi:repressor LexA